MNNFFERPIPIGGSVYRVSPIAIGRRGGFLVVGPDGDHRVPLGEIGGHTTIGACSCGNDSSLYQAWCDHQQAAVVYYRSGDSAGPRELPPAGQVYRWAVR